VPKTGDLAHEGHQSKPSLRIEGPRPGWQLHVNLYEILPGTARRPDGSVVPQGILLGAHLEWSAKTQKRKHLEDWRRGTPANYGAGWGTLAEKLVELGLGKHVREVLWR
jgi:hypothetical protein